MAMEEKEKKEKDSHVPILPFDASLDDAFVMYDNQTYERDRDLCHFPVSTENSNMVKYFSYQLEDEKTAISIN